ncbi:MULTISPECIES: FxLD family lanthipeptide [Micromonospora]|nr:FxLD family lanthipeptide [Micromonospora tulbaghiae]MDX5461281.1 FxLD family lanthipeptide [Micromonospora tulbaghiae]
MSSDVQIVEPPDLDLDPELISSGPIVPELMRSTDDGCGSTCSSACTTCS